MTNRATLDLGDGLTLPLEAVTQTFAILAKRGMGKTFTASVLIEEMLEHRQRVVVIDPVGVWWGLRSSATGKSAGYPVVIIGGDHGDLPLEVNSGELVADLIIDNDLAVVIDLSLLRKNQQRTFMTAFAERLYHRNRRPLHLVVDEADAYAPQRTPKGDGARLLGAMEDLVRRGRARGIGVTLISQRAAVLNKDVLTQAEVLIALRVTGPQDRAALDAWISQHGDPDQRDQLLASLASLPVGTAWVWSPGWLGLFRQVAIRRRRTFDSSATPEVGGQIVTPARYAKVDLDVVRGQMASVVEQAEADDPARLRARISDLERQLAARGTPEPVVQTVEVSVEVPVIDHETLAQLEEAVADANTAVNEVRTLLSGALDTIRAAANAPKPAASKKSAAVSNKKSTGSPAASSRGSGRAPGRPASPSSAAGRSDQDDIQLRAGARRMLAAAASFYPESVTRPQLGGLADLAHRAGTFSTYLSDLRRHDLIELDGDTIRATAAGIDHAGVDVPPAPTTVAEVRTLWQPRLRAGARRMLDAIIDADDGGITRDHLGELAEVEPSGGTFSTYLSTLRRYGLAVERHGRIHPGPAFDRLPR